MNRGISYLDNVSKKFATVEAKKQQIMEDDINAIRLTTSIEIPDEPHPNQRLTDSDGVSQPMKLLEVESIFITGKEMNELNLVRCKKIPKRPGADWRNLPTEKIKLSNGFVEGLIPFGLTNKAKEHYQWKGLFGRLDWQGNFPTSVTDPQPMGMVGMCFHPDQDRILTACEYARSQGFPDSFEFSGKIKHKHKQIGNAVPPPLAFALGRKLKESPLSQKFSTPILKSLSKFA